MHLKTHMGEKSDTNKQHGFSSGQEDNLKTNSKTHVGKKTKGYKAADVSMDPLLRGCIEEMLEKQDWKNTIFLKCFNLSSEVPIRFGYITKVNNVLHYPKFHGFESSQSINIHFQSLFFQAGSCGLYGRGDQASQGGPGG